MMRFVFHFSVMYYLKNEQECITRFKNWRNLAPRSLVDEDLVKSDFYTGSPVRNVTGDERAHARNKSSNLDVLNNEIDRAVKFSLTKRGYTHTFRSTQQNILRKRPKNNNKAWIKLPETILSILRDCWETFFCSSLPARLMEEFSASKVHPQPATWLTWKFPSRRMCRDYWPVWVSS